MSNHFVERQYTQMWWLRALVVIIALGAWASFIVQIFFDTPVGTNPSPDWAMYPLLVLAGIGLPWFFFSSHLETTVANDMLKVRYFPFFTKVYTREDIAQATAITFKPIRQHGGWGIRKSIDGTWVYSAHGNTGIELTFRDGKKLIVGSQRAEALTDAISAFL